MNVQLLDWDLGLGLRCTRYAYDVAWVRISIPSDLSSDVPFLTSAYTIQMNMIVEAHSNMAAVLRGCASMTLKYVHATTTPHDARGGRRQTRGSGCVCARARRARGRCNGALGWELEGYRRSIDLPSGPSVSQEGDTWRCD